MIGVDMAGLGSRGGKLVGELLIDVGVRGEMVPDGADDGGVKDAIDDF